MSILGEGSLLYIPIICSNNTLLELALLKCHGKESCACSMCSYIWMYVRREGILLKKNNFLYITFYAPSQNLGIQSAERRFVAALKVNPCTCMMKGRKHAQAITLYKCYWNRLFVWTYMYMTFNTSQWAWFSSTTPNIYKLK